jgi:hypothetical protein
MPRGMRDGKQQVGDETHMLQKVVVKDARSNSSNGRPPVGASLRWRIVGCHRRSGSGHCHVMCGALARASPEHPSDGEMLPRKALELASATLA